MQKFYSIVLMAVALLIGTNVKAADVAKIGNTPYATLQAAFENAQNDDVITLLDNVEVTNSIVLLKDQTVTLNLNGKNIEGKMAYSPYYSYKAVFAMYRGTLKIIGKGTISQANITNTKAVNQNSAVVVMYGTDNENDQNICNLIVGDGTVDENGEPITELKANGAKGCGVEVYAFGNNPTLATKVDGTNTLQQLIDNNGMSEIINYTTYVAKKPNGESNYSSAFGVTITIEKGAKVHGEKYGVQISGIIQHSGKNDPVINIKNGSEVSANATANEATGVYAAGVGVTNINGEVHGSTGVYIKSGEVNVGDGAVVYSDNDTYNDVDHKRSGVNAGGSAIIYETNNAYGGQITINVTDGATITGNSGYAIQGAQEPDVDNELKGINIQGGTIVAGDMGALETQVLEEAIKTGGATLVVDGATIQTDETDMSDLNDLLTVAGATSLIGQTEDGTYVIEQAPTGTTVVKNQDLNTTSEKYVELQNGTPQTLTKDVELTYLALQNATVNVPAGMTLKVGSIVMDASAVINVAAGAKLVITGENGLVANNVNNIKIAYENGVSGLFMLTPAAKANKNPAATVTLATKAYKNGDTYVWERIGCPAYEGIKAGDIVKNVTSYIQYWDPIQGKYVGISGANHMLQPFQGLSLTNDAAAAGQTYQFPCKLVGNTNGNLQLVGEWTSFANSYMADVDLYAFLGDILAADNGVSASVYVYDGQNDHWTTISYAKLNSWKNEGGNKPAYTALAPIQGFIFNNLNASFNADAVIDYENDVWDPVFDQNHAVPQGIAARRNTINNTTRVQINITAENGQNDEITLRQSEDFSAAFDNGYDAKKNVELNPVNIFATTELGNMAELSSDNIIGTNLSIATKNETMFKMTFSNLNGEQLAIRDNLTGSVIDMTEGAEYFFAVSEGNNANRFQIIGINNAPTAIENVAAEGAKAVYTVLGQYMGTTDNWNTLPNGIYVVDGVKMVK